jgi:hypothetical protein
MMPNVTDLVRMLLYDYCLAFSDILIVIVLTLVLTMILKLMLIYLNVAHNILFCILLLR